MNSLLLGTEYAPSGLSSASVDLIRKQYGYNELSTPKESLFVVYIKNFWGPLPWLMETLVIVSWFSHQKVEAGVILLLLLINSIVSVMQRRSADAALAILTEKLITNTRVFRDGTWQTIATRELLPGDIVRIRVGEIVPADILVEKGSISVDMSSLTGESLPKDIAAGDTIYSGCVVRRGEITGKVTAIGSATVYGKTATLLETSHPPTHMEKIIFSIIKYFFILNVILSIIIIIFGLYVHAATIEIVNFVIVLLLTSVPISFPTMFAVAQSYGALQLSKEENEGVLVRRLAAVQECAIADVFCSDKTGTLTENRLKVGIVTAYGTYSENNTLTFAAACSEQADSGSIDMAILQAVEEKALPMPLYKNFIPFDFITKRTEADVTTEKGVTHVFMGLPELLLGENVLFHAAAHADVERLSKQGLRVLAVIAEYEHAKECVGLVTLSDPIRSDAPQLIQELSSLGVRVVMITGDGCATARAIAQQLGLTGDVITADDLKKHPEKALTSVVFAEAYPEDKLTIICALQQAGHTVGMTGDGVNDAPALRQAEVGIAVCGATDVAKQSASFILTKDGLEGVIHAIKISRHVYSRLRTWAMNKIVKSIEVAVFTTVLFFITHSYILSPLLAVLLIFANDFVTISIATDNVRYDARPGKWNIKSFIGGAIIVALVPVVLLMVTYYIATTHHYSIDVARTIIYLALIFYGKSNLYAIRSWPHAWRTRPSLILVMATLFSLLFALTISVFGILISPISLSVAGIITVLAIINFFGVDAIKNTPIVRRLIGV
jgi:H+-transporting ATPase